MGLLFIIINTVTLYVMYVHVHPGIIDVLDIRFGKSIEVGELRTLSVAKHYTSHGR